jgi:hypothetical protein
MSAVGMPARPPVCPTLRSHWSPNRTVCTAPSRPTRGGDYLVSDVVSGWVYRGNDGVPRSADVCGTTASPPEADMPGSPSDVAEGPGPDVARQGNSLAYADNSLYADKTSLVRSLAPLPAKRVMTWGLGSANRAIYGDPPNTPLLLEHGAPVGVPCNLEKVGGESGAPLADVGS